MELKGIAGNFMEFVGIEWNCVDMMDLKNLKHKRKGAFSCEHFSEYTVLPFCLVIDGGPVAKTTLSSSVGFQVRIMDG